VPVAHGHVAKGARNHEFLLEGALRPFIRRLLDDGGVRAESSVAEISKRGGGQNRGGNCDNSILIHDLWSPLDVEALWPDPLALSTNPFCCLRWRIGTQER